MALSFPPAPRWVWAATAALLLLLAVMLSVALLQRNTTEVSTDAGVPPVVASPPGGAVGAGNPILPILPEGGRVLFLGDSYTEGYGGEPKTAGYAHLLTQRYGWVADIRGIGGSGWLNPGPQNLTYSQRLEAVDGTAPDLVIVQGGLNDKGFASKADFEDAVNRFIVELRVKYPDTEILFFGPVNPQAPLQQDLADIDRSLLLVTQANGVPYVSPVQGRWQVWPFMQNEKVHPDNLGYQYMVERLAADLLYLSVPHDPAVVTPPASAALTSGGG